MGEKSKWFSWRVFSKNYILQNYSSKKVETARSELGAIGSSKNGWAIQTSLSYNHEFVTETFELSETALIPIGEYDFFQFNGMLTTPFTQYIGAILQWNVGQFYDGSLQSIAIFPHWKLSSHFDLEGLYQFNYGRFTKRDQEFTAHLVRIKALYMLNTQFSIAAFIQYNSLDLLYSGNIRLRYNPKEGHDLYLVYNDLLNEDREREVPHLPFSSSRTLVLKYTYTFNL